MTIKELIEELEKYDENHTAVLTVFDEDRNYSTYLVRNVDDGWEPSGIISIETDQESFIGG